MQFGLWKRNGLLCSSALAALALAAPAAAQSGGSLDEIIITATRTETNLQRTPVAVTALSADALEERGVDNLIDLGAIAPNVSIGSRAAGGSALGTVTIRGIGVDGTPPAAAAVGIYIDEVYYPSSWGNLLGLFDVGRIEVLRGPQGTLFGRNTISGAIQYVTKGPQIGEFGGFVEGTAGNLDRSDVSGAMNIPLGEQAALRISASTQDRDGHVHDTLNDVDRGAEQASQARVQFRLEATERLRFDLKAETIDMQQNGRATIATGFNYGAAFAGPPGGLDPFVSTDFYTNAGFDAPDFFEATFNIIQGAITYDISDNLRLKSISAYSETESRSQVDTDNTPAPLVATSLGDTQDDLFTQELQLSGDSFSDRLHWTAGLYYYDNALTIVNQDAVIFGAPLPGPQGDQLIETTSWAAYGQATFDLTERLSVVAGIRYTEEEADLSDTGGFGLPAYSQSLSFDDTSPLIGVNFQATEDLLLYFKGSRGFRAGGFSPTVDDGNAYDPEVATTYEIGARAELFGGRLRLNPTVFKTEWDDIQFNTLRPCTCFFPGPVPFIQNAGDAEIQGAELEVQWAVSDTFLLTAAAGWLDGEYTSIAPDLAAVPPPNPFYNAPKLTSESELKRAPETQFSINARYSHSLGAMGELTSSFGYSWQADQRSATTDGDNVEIESYGLLNGRLEYEAPGGGWTLALFGTNLTDEEYAIGGTNYGNGGAVPTTTVDVGRPREYGLTLRVNY